MNRVTFQFRKIYDLDKNGKEVGPPMFGYCIISDNYTVINSSMCEDEEWQDMLSWSPQDLLEYILEYYGEKFEDHIKGRGFYINNSWVSVNEKCKVISI